MINKFIRFCVFFSCIYLLASPVLAQPSQTERYTIRHFTDENGLPQNSINDLLFDDEGYLWLGSQVGLVRFNGYSFKLFYPNDKPAMESNVKTLGKNELGHIYFQTSDHNLYCYPGNNSHLLSPVNSWDLRDPRLLNGRKQLFDFSRFLHNAPGPDEKEKRKLIFRDLFDHNGNFYAVDPSHAYILYKDSLYYYGNDSLLPLASYKTFQPYYLILGDRFYVLDNNAVLGAYRNGLPIHVASQIGGQLNADAAKDRSISLFTSASSAHLLSGSKLYRLSADSSGSLVTEFLLDVGFIVNISAIEYNKQLDLLLIATGTDGFYSLRKSGFQRAGFPQPLQTLLSRHLFGPMTLLDDHNILTDKFIFDAAGHFKMVDVTPGAWYKCLYKDHDGLIWSAIHNLPRRMSQDMKTIGVFPTLDARIVDYSEDEKGNLYCLTERSLWRLEKDGFRRISQNQPSLQGTNESLALSGPGHFFIANTMGMMEFDCPTGLQKIVPLFSNAHVRSFYRCHDSSMLIGTYGQGYFYFHKRRFHRMPLDKNGFLITAHCFLEDSRHDIWISCNKGLFRLPKADLDKRCAADGNPVYYYYYGREDGLLTNEFNGGFNASGLITPGNFITLLSMKGMVCFHTDSLRADFPHGKMAITDVEIDGRSSGNYDSIALPADYNSLLIEISCPYLGNRANLYMEYRLKGLDIGWRQVPDDGTINLSRLGSGQYTLQVRKVNGFGKNNYSYAEWPIAVTPHFYSTTWFRILAVLAITILLLLLVQTSIKLNEKRKEIRINTEKLKGTVTTLEETVRKLQESEQALLHTSRLREKLISLVIHDLRSPLRFLTMLAGDLHDNQDRLSAAEMKERSYWVKKGTNDIYHFSEDFLLWVTSQKDNFNINNSLFPLKPLVQEIYDFYIEQALQKGNTIAIDIAEDCSIYSDPHILITIIRNLVDNANKYTDQGSILISAAKEEPFVIISVSDTGKGMSREQVQRFLRNENLDNVHTGSQLGHKFVFDLTGSINGSVSVDSLPGKGTTVMIRLPKNAAP